VDCLRQHQQQLSGAIHVVINGVRQPVVKQLTVTVPTCPRYEVIGLPSAVASIQGIRTQNKDQLHVFVRAPGTPEGNTLWWCRHAGDPSKGVNWHWEDLGKPSGHRLTDTPAAIAVEQPSLSEVNESVHVFVQSRDGSLHKRKAATSTLQAWSAWEHLGAPSGGGIRGIVGELSVGAFRTVHGEGEALLFDTEPRVLVSSRGDQEALLLSFEEKVGWRARQRPHSSPDAVEPTDIIQVGDTVVEPNGVLTYVYVIGADGKLYAHGSRDALTTWQWIRFGQPSGTVQLSGGSSVAVGTFRFEGHDRFYAFAKGTDGNLWHNVWRGALAHANNDPGTWGNLGAPPGTAIRSAASVVTHGNQGSAQIYAFVVGSDSGLHACSWNASAGHWQWSNLGKPEAAGLRGRPSAVASDYYGRIFVFASGNDDYLHMCVVSPGLDSISWEELS
jgi:hypothetical protein